MEIPSSRRSEAVKTVGSAARDTFQEIVKDAVTEAMRETDSLEVSGSSGGSRNRSLALIGIGIAIGFLAAKYPETLLRTAGKSIGESSGGPFEAVEKSGDHETSVEDASDDEAPMSSETTE